MAISAKAPELDLPAGRTHADREPRRAVPVKWWAALGALVVAFEAFVVVRWVTGPFFKEVPSGPSKPPDWMKAELVAWQVILPVAALGAIYWFAVRPWRRERRIGVDGLLVIAFATLWFQDPLSAYGGPWFTYNSWLVNFGSWVNDVPGWLSFGAPGHMIAVPILLLPAAYVCIFMVGALLGSWVMRKARARWPQIGNLGLVGICFVAMIAFDVVFEGLIFLPLGAWAYPGGHIALFPGTYHKYPLNEALTTGALFTGLACLRYFTDDRGQTLVERGIERIQGSTRRKLLLRALAMIAAAHVTIFALYNVPNFWIGLHSDSWPADLQKRSYLTDYLCGDGTGRACPGPAVPLVRNDNDNAGGGSAYLGIDGQLAVPPRTKLPKLVPFQ